MGKRQWERVLDMVGKIRGLNMEVCTTLGMLTPEQAAQLRIAGLTAYNHNLDTSPEYYPKVTSSRKYQVGCLLLCLVSAIPHSVMLYNLCCDVRCASLPVWVVYDCLTAAPSRSSLLLQFRYI